ncbi:MAG: ABC transporter ATP-binding protein [Cyclobacteriaceae bacterium]
MKTFFKILSVASPLKGFIFPYICFTILYVLFNLINFSALIPILEVLFNGSSPNEPQIPTSTGFGAAKEWYYYYFNDLMFENGAPKALLVICAVVLASVLLANIFRYLAELSLVSLRVKIIENMRKRLFNRMIDLPLSFFSDSKHGELVSRITTDIQEVETSVIYTLKIMLKEPLMILGFLLMLFSISVELTLYSLVLFPIAGLVISALTKRLKSKANETQEALGEIGSVVNEAIWGMRIIKAFNAQSFIGSQMTNEIEKYSEFNRSFGKKFQLAGPLSEFLGVTTVLCILLIGGNMVLEENYLLPAPQFLVFLIIFSQILPPAKAISQAYTLMQRGLASAERVFELENKSDRIIEEKKSIHVTKFTERIELKNVHFSYDKTEILKGINLTFEKGKKYALVGSSGSGKSTLVDLLPRFHDVTLGEVLFDGINIKKYGIKSLRDEFAIVNQEPILFNDTVANNISLLKNSEKEKIIESAIRANAHDFITELPKGYDTIIGNRGNKLSGGEKQRIAIARAIYKNAPILILDEATSSLDAISEKKIADALATLMKGRTTIVISHQVQSAIDADYVVVLEEGLIKQKGTHRELIGTKGVYKNLFSLSPN